MVGLPGIVLGTSVVPPCTRRNDPGRIPLPCCFGLDTGSAVVLGGWRPWISSSHANVVH